MENFSRREPELMLMKRLDGETVSQYSVLYVTPEGVFFGKVWTLFTRHEGTDIFNNRLKTITGAKYWAQVEGYNVFITVEDLCGYDSLTELYDPNLIVRLMADHLLRTNIQSRPGSWKDFRA
jgi:hypothetical protein